MVDNITGLMDWRALLVKYIYHIGMQEGVYFLHEYKKPDYFSDAEFDALLKASKDSDELCRQKHG